MLLADDLISMAVQIGVEEQKQVLRKRKGNTISKRSILKSYKPVYPDSHNAVQLEGVADIRKVQSLPVYTVGSCTAQVQSRTSPSPLPGIQAQDAAQEACVCQLGERRMLNVGGIADGARCAGYQESTELAGGQARR